MHRLEQLPVNASYPSGHTAAAIAVYCGIALLLASRLKRWGAQRAAIWSVALALPVYVALSRMYRGMHHPLDCVGSVVIGVAALAALVLCCRAAGMWRRTTGPPRDERRLPDGRSCRGRQRREDVRRSVRRDCGARSSKRGVVTAPFWAEVPKSKKAPKQVEPSSRPAPT